MGILIAIGGIIGAVITAILLGLIKDEVKDWLPSLISFVLKTAVRRLPEEKRDRYREEWAAHVESYAGRLTQLLQSLLCLSASVSMREPSEFSIADKRWRNVKQAIAISGTSFIATLFMYIFKSLGGSISYEERLIYLSFTLTLGIVVTYLFYKDRKLAKEQRRNRTY